MLRTASPARRLAGRALIFAGVAAALPLTASHAIAYVDVPVPVAAPVPVQAVPAAPAVATPVAPVVAAAAIQAPPPMPPVPARPAAIAPRANGDVGIHGDLITIDGKTKRWEDLTPAEKAKVSAAIANARAALEKTHIDRARIMRDVTAATHNIDVAQLQRSIAQSEAGVAEAVRAVDANAALLRASGQDPEKLKASVRQAVESARRIDIEAIRTAMASVDPQKMALTLSGAEESIARARAELDRMDARLRAEQQH